MRLLALLRPTAMSAFVPLLGDKADIRRA